MTTSVVQEAFWTARRLIDEARSVRAPTRARQKAPSAIVRGVRRRVRVDRLVAGVAKATLPHRQEGMTSLQAYDIAARRRERILANREKRLALASGRSAEVVQEAARRDAAGLSGTLHSGERVRQLMERETPAAHLDRRKRKSSEGLQRASSWREGVLLVAAAALAWLHTRDADPCWRASAAAPAVVECAAAAVVWTTAAVEPMAVGRERCGRGPIPASGRWRVPVRILFVLVAARAVSRMR
eukprot:ctg_341.g109